MIKRFMISAVLVSTLALQGCLYQSVSAHEVEIAEMICDSKNYSVVHISEFFNGDSQVRCSDDKIYAIKMENVERK